jgi:hypothetical protein
MQHGCASKYLEHMMAFILMQGSSAGSMYHDNNALLPLDVAQASPAAAASKMHGQAAGAVAELVRRAGCPHDASASWPLDMFCDVAASVNRLSSCVLGCYMSTTVHLVAVVVSIGSRGVTCSASCTRTEQHVSLIRCPCYCYSCQLQTGHGNDWNRKCLPDVPGAKSHTHNISGAPSSG